MVVSKHFYRAVNATFLATLSGEKSSPDTNVPAGDAANPSVETATPVITAKASADIPNPGGV